MKYYVATNIGKHQGWASFYIIHFVNDRDDGDGPWTSTKSTDILADATAFSTKKEAEKILDAAYVNPVGRHATKSECAVIEITEKQYFHAKLTRGTRGWIGQT